jgi:CHAT domain-containing protein
MTLWRVSQAQTFELLQAFANRLKRGKGKAEALREAQQQMLRKYPIHIIGLASISSVTQPHLKRAETGDGPVMLRRGSTALTFRHRCTTRPVGIYRGLNRKSWATGCSASN